MASSIISCACAVKPVNIDGRVMIPFRAALENMGATVDYNDAERLVTAKKGLGKTSVLVQFGMDTLLNGKQLVHISFNQMSANVITWYDGIFNEISKKKALSNAKDVKEQILKNRTILNFNQDIILLRR